MFKEILDSFTFEKVGEYISDASGWMEDHPNSTEFITSAAGAGINYLSARESAKEQIKQDERRYQRSLVKSPKGNYDYNTSLSSLTDGLLIRAMKEGKK